MLNTPFKPSRVLVACYITYAQHYELVLWEMHFYYGTRIMFTA